MKTVAGLAAAAVLLTGAWSAGAQPETETPSSSFVLISERGHDSPRFTGVNTPAASLLADAQEAQARDGRPGRGGPPDRGRISERREDERASRRGPAEAREAMQRVRIRRLAETMDLEDEETEKLVQRMETHEEKQRELERELGQARRDLRRALREDEDEDTISEKLHEALELEGRKVLHRRDGYRGMTEGFDVEQQARFYLFLPEFEQDMRRLVEHARHLRHMEPGFPEKLREMGPREQREFFREHGLFPGRRDEVEAAPDARRRERPEARREDREERPRVRREGIGEEEREAVRERLERMVEDMGEEEAERWRERLEHIFDFVSEEVPEAWREGMRELREQWLERRENNSDEAEGRARRFRDGARERLRKLREEWRDMSPSERREAIEERFQRHDDMTEEDVRRFMREGPERRFPRLSERDMETLRELREGWAGMSRSERRELLEKVAQPLDDVTEADLRRFLREGPDRRFPRVGVDGRPRRTERPRERDRE